MGKLKEYVEVLKCVKRCNITSVENYEKTIKNLQYILDVVSDDLVYKKTKSILNVLNKYSLVECDNPYFNISKVIVCPKGSNISLVKSEMEMSRLDATRYLECQMNNYKIYVSDLCQEGLEKELSITNKKLRELKSKEKVCIDLLFLVNTEVPDTEGRLRNFTKKVKETALQYSSESIRVELLNLVSYLNSLEVSKKTFSGVSVNLFYNKTLDKNANKNNMSKFQKFEYYKFIDNEVRRTLHIKMSMLAEALRKDLNIVGKRAKSYHNLIIQAKELI